MKSFRGFVLLMTAEYLQFCELLNKSAREKLSVFTNIPSPGLDPGWQDNFVLECMNMLFSTQLYPYIHSYILSC
jgi:hypothetical protein